MVPNRKQKDRAVLLKPKLIVYIGKSQKVFEPDPNPKKKALRVQKFILPTTIEPTF